LGCNANSIRWTHPCKSSSD